MAPKHGDLALAVEYGTAHAVHAMTTPGDTSGATLAEVEALMGAGGARVPAVSRRVAPDQRTIRTSHGGCFSTHDLTEPITARSSRL